MNEMCRRREKILAEKAETWLVHPCSMRRYRDRLFGDGDVESCRPDIRTLDSRHSAENDIKGVGRFNVRHCPSPPLIYFRRSAAHTFPIFVVDSTFVSTCLDSPSDLPYGVDGSRVPSVPGMFALTWQFG